MKKIFIYKKWNYLILLNNLITLGNFSYTKKIVFLHFDVNKFYFWIYNKKIKLQNKKIVYLKKKFNFN